MKKRKVKVMNKVIHELRDYFDKVFNSEKLDAEIRIMAWKVREILKACIVTYESNHTLSDDDIEDLKTLYNTSFRPAFKEEIKAFIEKIKRERNMN
jgi:hypothetical protein